jgi:hypothetical protein
MEKSLLRRALRFQAAYYVVAGLWPVVSLSSFEAVTGPKTDGWLVHMVGLLAAVIGATLGAGTMTRQRIGVDLLVLSVGSAASFAAIELWYGLSDRIGVIDLADAVLELSLITWILIARRREPRDQAAS